MRQFLHVLLATCVYELHLGLSCFSEKVNFDFVVVIFVFTVLLCRRVYVVLVLLVGYVQLHEGCMNLAMRYCVLRGGYPSLNAGTA